jgi:hypothetical protein
MGRLKFKGGKRKGKEKKSSTVVEGVERSYIFRITRTL